MDNSETTSTVTYGSTYSTSDVSEVKPETYPRWIILDETVFYHNGDSYSNYKAELFELLTFGISTVDRLIYFDHEHDKSLEKLISRNENIIMLENDDSETIYKLKNQADEVGAVLIILGAAAGKLISRDEERDICKIALVFESINSSNDEKSNRTLAADIPPSIDSIISLSRSITEELLQDSAKKFIKIEGDPFYEEEDGNVNNIITTVETIDQKGTLKALGGFIKDVKQRTKQLAETIIEHVKGTKHRGKHCYHKDQDLNIKLSTENYCSRALCQCPFEFTDDKLICKFGNEHYEQKHYQEYICPQQFRDLADWVFRWNAGHHNESIKVSENAKQMAPCLREGAILYVNGWFLNTFFIRIYPHLKNKFVLITGESVLTVPYPHQIGLVTGESKVIHWFGQNGRKMPPGARFTHIPTGLNCLEHTAAISQVAAKYRQDTTVATGPMPDLISETSILKIPSNDPHSAVPQRSFKNWLLLNFDANTDETGERKNIVQKACNSSVNNWSTFADCVTKEKGVRQYVSNLYDIHKRNLQYPFWLSPRGNGVDCHRTYEALYMGRIPIVRKSDITHMYEDLPVVVVDNWDVINEEFLKEKYMLIMKGRSDGIYNYQKLNIHYWEKMILRNSAYVGVSQRPNRCWRPKNMLSN